ncbi:hypothetical protein CR513_51209, partial [Mucuna pruriens]
MTDNNRTLKELAIPMWCINLGVSNILSWNKHKLRSLSLDQPICCLSEDPHKHLKEFRFICSTVRPHEILENYIKMKAFPFSLHGVAKDWLYL